MDFIEVSPLPEICKTVGIDFFALKTEKVNGAAMNATTWGNALCVSLSLYLPQKTLLYNGLIRYKGMSFTAAG